VKKGNATVTSKGRPEGAMGVLYSCAAAALMFMRDVWGQLMVFLFDTLINRPFLNILNR